MHNIQYVIFSTLFRVNGTVPVQLVLSNTNILRLKLVQIYGQSKAESYAYVRMARVTSYITKSNSEDCVRDYTFYEQVECSLISNND